jgi:hypothetical protein
MLFISHFSLMDIKIASILIVLRSLGELNATEAKSLTMTGLSSFSPVNITTQQRVTNEHVTSVDVDVDAFDIWTTHFDASQLNQTTTEEEPYQCGEFFVFH